MNNIPTIIKRLREKMQLSPTALADRSGLSPAYISKLENGEYVSISLKTSRALAQGLGITLRELLTELGLLENQERPSLDMINHAFRSNGYSTEQVKEIMQYAKYLKSKK